MSGTNFTSTSNGDWGTGTIWNTGSVPDAPTADVTIANNVTIGASESFAAGTVTVDSADSLSVDGGLFVADMLQVLSSMTDTGSVTVSGAVTVAAGASITLGSLSFGFPPTIVSTGTVTAGSYLIDGVVTGVGTLAGAGTLLSNGSIFSDFHDTITIAPGVYQQSASGQLNAFGDDSIILVAPTGTFANMSFGTLTAGTYTAGGGTLELPDAISAIVSATITIPSLGGAIEAGGSSLEATLGTIGRGAELNVNGTDYVTTNTLTVNGGTVLPGFDGTLSAGGLTLANAASTLQGPGTVTSDITDNGLILVQAGTLAIGGAVSGDGSISIQGVDTITAASITLNDGGITISDGSLSVADTLAMNGGTITLNEALSAGTLVLGTSATTLQGSGTVTASIDNAGHIYANGGVSLDLAGPVSGAGILEIAANNGLELAQAASETVSFDPVGSNFFGQPVGATLRLDQPGSFAGTITDFGTKLQHGQFASDSIDLVGFTPGTLTDVYNGTTMSGALTIDSGTTVIATLNFAGDYTKTKFTLEPEGSAGSYVEIAPPPIFSDAANGDWNTASSWSPAIVPDSTADNVLIDQHTIFIASGSAFTVGNLVMSGTADSEFPVGTWGTLAVAGTLDVAQQLTVESTADLQIDVNALVTAGSISNSSGVPIHGAGTLQTGGTLGGQVLANMPGQTLTVMPTAFDGLPEANGAGATLLLMPAGGASGYLNAAGGTLTSGARAIQGGTLLLPGTITEVLGSTLSTPQITLDGAGSSILAGGEPIQNSLTLLTYGAQLVLDNYDYQGTAALTAGGFIGDGGGSATLAPASYGELASGDIDASGTLVLAPGTFANLANGTLSLGSYGSSGTLELPGTVTELLNATISLASGAITTGGSPIQNSLSIVGGGGELAISSGTYSTTNTLTVNDGTILLSGFESNAIFSPATLTLDPGASVLQGAGTVTAGINNLALILANQSGQLLDLTGSIAGAGSLEIARGASLELAQGNSENLSFDPDAAGVLVLAQPGSYSGTLTGFSTGIQGGVTFADKIDLPAFAPGTLTDTYNGNAAGGTLTIEHGTTIVSTLHFAGDYSQHSFTLEPDTGTGTFIGATPPAIIESTYHGDWSLGTIWSTGTAPDNAADYVLLQTQVAVAAGESFTVGTLEISEVNLYAGVGDTFLNAIGTLDAAQLVTIDFDAELTLGAAGQAGFVVAPTVVNAGTINGVGTLIVGGSVASTGLIDASTGLLDITAPITGSGSLEIGQGATLELGGASSQAAGFDPLGPAGTLDVLKLDSPDFFTGMISGFTAAMSGGVTSADAVDLVGLAPGTLKPGYSGNATGGTLTITNGTSLVANLAFAGNYVNAHFTLDPDGASGSNVELVPCYAAGTRIATPHGEVAVEHLRAGDLVLTAAGKPKKIRWIGHRRVDCTRHPRPDLVWPVRIRAGAFGPAEPARDLWLSPDHAVFCAPGFLIPVKYLVNGATVVQEPRDQLTYWHLELRRHEVILAEGLPCESYLDTGNRGAFTNGGAATHLHPDFALRVWQAGACAPLVTTDPRLAEARAGLLQRLPALGFVISDRPALRFLADDTAEIKPWVFGGSRFFSLPDDTKTLRIASRHAAPAELDPASTDCRRLGVPLAQLRLDGEPVSLDSPGLARGWHAPEPGLRWTDGAAVLEVAGARLVELRLAAVRLRYAVPVGMSDTNRRRLPHGV